MTDKSTVAERLGTALKERGIMQRQLAEKAGVTETTISRYVNGTRTPKGNNIKKIADALNVSADYLLGVDVKDSSTAYFDALAAVERHAGSWTDVQKTALVVALFQSKKRWQSDRS